MKHSQGDWSIFEGDDFFSIRTTESSHAIAVMRYEDSTGMHRRQQVMNARLFLAAPKLLAALQWLEQDMNTPDADGRVCAPDSQYRRVISEAIREANQTQPTDEV